MPRRKNSSAPKTLGETLDRLAGAARSRDRVSLDDMMEALGHRSFGPLILLAGIVLSAPGISDVPSVPTITGIFVGVVAGQMICGHEEFWLPAWLLRRSVSSERMIKITGSKWARKPAKLIDRFVMRRLDLLSGPGATRAVAVVCLLLALVSPFTEFVPLSGMAVGAALLAFGISLVARDGLMALLGFLLSTVTLLLAAFGVR